MTPEPKSRSRGANRPYPAVSVDDATRVAKVIKEQNAAKPMNRLLLADALGASPGSSTFRDLVAASARYGFTEGNYNSDTISLTTRGTNSVSADKQLRLEAMRDGLRSIDAFEKAFTFYDQHRIPDKPLMIKAVQDDDIGIPAAWAEEFVDVFIRTGREVGFIREISGSPHVLLEAGAPQDPILNVDEDMPRPDETAAENAQPDGSAQLRQHDLREPREPVRPKALQFFVAHGTNHKPLDQLKAILQQFGIPFVVAQDEPHAGRPISTKVKDLMDSCTGGIFIFTADEEFTAADGTKVLRPRENVVYELGAASYLYGRSIVVLKERGIHFPTDFSDLGWIEFEPDRLDAKAMDLIRELLKLGALKLVAGG